MPNDFSFSSPRYSFPHQREIIVHREELKNSFLGINNDNWMAASRDLGATGLRLYLYLAANKNGYAFSLSPEAIRQEIGMPRSTYHDWFKILQEKGYLVPAHGNTFDFYEVPRAIEHETSAAAFVHQNEFYTVSGITVPNDGKLILPEDIEINRINNSIDRSIDNEKTFQEKKEEKEVFDFHGMF